MNYEDNHFFVLSSFTQACIPTKMDVGYVNWDVDGDHRLNNFEFEKGYQKSHYFLLWQKKGRKLNRKQFHNAVFNKLDENKDGILTDTEFNSRIDYYYFSKATQKFRQWDGDYSKGITKNEFDQRATKSDLVSMWDTSADKDISHIELAHGMFYLCDLNKDGSIDPIEFNIWNINR